MRKYKIYLLTNTVNGKKYVGQTKSKPAKTRLRGHLSAANNGSMLPLHNAIRKYGIENFEFLILEDWDNPTETNEAEEWWIQSLGTYEREFGYNIRTSAQGHSVPEEMKDRIRESLAEYHAKMPFSEKISRAHKLREANQKQFATEEARNRHSEIMKQYYSDPDKRICGPKVGHKFGPYDSERREKARQGLLKYYRDHPNAGAAITARQVGKNLTPNTKRDPETGRFLKKEPIAA